MELKSITKEELELLSYTDLTEVILKEIGKPINTAAVFKMICDLLGYTDNEYTDKIGDYYTSLTTDKRFVFLETNEWDLKEKHSVKIVLDDDEMEDDVEDEEEVELEPEEEVLEDIDTPIDDDLDDDEDDDLDDLDKFFDFRD